MKSHVNFPNYLLDFLFLLEKNSLFFFFIFKLINNLKKNTNNEISKNSDLSNIKFSSFFTVGYLADVSGSKDSLTTHDSG